MLIVVRDADEENYDDVQRIFDQSVSFAVIPKRHIETWYYYLDNPGSSDSGDEICKRKNQYPKFGVKPTQYGKRLEAVANEIRQGKMPSNVPDSLFRALKHLVECERNKRLIQEQ
jgi:hypothetical protein